MIGVIVLTYWIISVLLLIVFGEHVPIWVGGLTIGLFAVCNAMDTVATYRALSLRCDYDDRGLPFPTYEANPLLPDAPSLGQLIFGKATVVALCFVPLMLLFPPVGWALAAGHAAAIIGNKRRRRQMQRELALFDKRVDEGLKNKARDTQTKVSRAPSSC